MKDSEEESSTDRLKPLGIVINPVSGRDARRLFARAMSSSHESKRNQIERLIVGAAAAGVRRVVLVGDPFRLANAAVEALGVDIEVDLHDIGASCKTSDTVRAVELMREEGCGALAVLGGDGTSRIVSRTWPDVAILPVSTGTNNVFPVMVEATVAGAAVGLVASGQISIADAARRSKVIHIEMEGAPGNRGPGSVEAEGAVHNREDLALIDAVHMVNDSTGNLLPFDPTLMRTLVLSRALPWSVGMSPVGGLLLPCDADDDFAVRVDCTGPDEGSRELLAPISPGLYRKVYVASSAKLALGEQTEVVGPGLLAFDGDREHAIEAGQRAWLRVERDGPNVIDIQRTLRAAARQEIYLDRGHWHDHRDGAGLDCC